MGCLRGTPETLNPKGGCRTENFLKSDVSPVMASSGSRGQISGPKLGV